ncbi:hypothetical protein FSARC_3539 [Fusarium sarcochroum]|uniref:Uncharacterized protein n=1 Tax=Fusarium sarcochroum TaxID=1208366 RepID=A0A8H4U3N1_9HYPO|nr:hypothetical protein FSARC_3539 [Fusarium sarcochroum]
MVRAWTRALNRRLAWLDELDVYGKVQLGAGFDGLLGFEGMPLEDSESLLPPAAMTAVLQRALKDPSNHPLMLLTEVEEFLARDASPSIFDLLEVMNIGNAPTPGCSDTITDDETPVKAWCAQYVCRMARFRVDRASDPPWWFERDVQGAAKRLCRLPAYRWRLRKVCRGQS